MSLTTDTPSHTHVSAQFLNMTLLRSANFYEAKCFKDCNIQTILGAFVELFKTKLLKSSISMVSKSSASMIAAIQLNKNVAVDQNTIEPLSKALSLEQDSMDEDADSISTDNVDKISTLLKLLLLFPNEYYEKNERPQALYLVTLLDIWSVSCKNADLLARMKVCLMCRSLQLRFIGYFKLNSILGVDSVVLNWLVSSNQIWPVEGSKELENVRNSLEQITNELDFSILRKIIMSASTKVPDVQSISYLQTAMTQRVKELAKDVPKIALGKIINLIKAINNVLINRKSNEVDLTDVIYATDTISEVSKFITLSLQDAKSSISTILSEFKDEPSKKADVIAEHKSKFDSIKHIFHITRLLQDYARIVGPDVDEVISAESLSKTLTELASPFIQFLQSALLLNNSENITVLNMTTEFIAAFCSILSRYQQVETTKRVLAAIWFVYSLVLNTGDQDSIEILSNAFISWIQSLSKDQYIIVIDGFVEQAEEEAINRGVITKENHHLVFLSLLSILLKNCNNSEKGRLRKNIPTFILKLSLIAGKTTSLKYLQQMLQLLIQLTGDQSYHFSDYDASLVLSCLLQVAHPTAIERFKGQVNRESAHIVFDNVCTVLSNLVSQHKEQVVYMMPPFIAFIQSLFHCFKSTHVSLVSGTNAPTRKRKLNAEQKNNGKAFAGRTIPLLYEFAPLDDASAQKLARVLTTIPQKQHSTSTAKNAKSTQTLHKIIAKHTSSILIEYFTIQSNPTMSIVRPSTKSVLTQALYEILDMCSESDHTFILSCLDGPGKSLFKSFYTNWKDTHKYTGQ
ncbi:Urb2/Npa2 family-domain-containing protein [Mucor mucedo]|uniref:Urb2/Npa2 family-domain-containing protein n=1 Tax=Mucor mucedo TaxID=29922 RepID=UPI00221E4071|nr:Urb2/Npa2 family-domain-containing protein [Mucor mucedo]KAI7891608.1 Urb2/Npa2 family-domain-containing protein [Mucor mucedo]